MQYDLEEAKERTRRTRIALISTSAAFAVGAILTGVGFSQCTRVQTFTPYSDELVCNTAGDVPASTWWHPRFPRFRRGAHLRDHVWQGQPAKTGDRARHSAQPVRSPPPMGHSVRRFGLLSAGGFEIVDLYTTWQRPTLCEVIGCIPSPDECFGTFLGTTKAPSTLHPANDWAKGVEAVGIGAKRRMHRSEARHEESGDRLHQPTGARDPAPCPGRACPEETLRHRTSAK